MIGDQEMKGIKDEALSVRTDLLLAACRDHIVTSSFQLASGVIS
jgi:hypothetical protein